MTDAELFTLVTPGGLSGLRLIVLVDAALDGHSYRATVRYVPDDWHTVATTNRAGRPAVSATSEDGPLPAIRAALLGLSLQDIHHQPGAL